MLVDRLHGLLKLRERGGGVAEHRDRQVPDGLRDLVPQDGEGLLLLAGDQDPLAVADQVADQVGDGVRLAGPRRPLHGDTAMLGQPPGDRLLLRVGRQRHQQPLGRLLPGAVLARASGPESSRLGSSATTAASGAATSSCSDTSASRRLAKNRRNIVLRRRTSSTQVAVIVGADVAGAGSRALSDLAVEPERGQQLLVEMAGPLIERPDGIGPEPLADVNQQVEPVQPSPCSRSISRCGISASGSTEIAPVPGSNDSWTWVVTRG